MILIVDDLPDNIFTLKKILEHYDFPVDTALGGEEALKKILRNNYALIILDVQMPGMDGFEVAEIISGYSNAQDSAIIFLSAASTDKKFITRGYKSGGIDYISKPIDPDILILKVKTFYRLYEQKRELNEMQTSLRKEIEFRKMAQARLTENMQELHSILESIPQVAFTASRDGHIEFVNKHWFNLSESALHFPETHSDEPDIQPAWKQAVADAVPLEMEVRIRNSGSANYRYYLLRALPVREKEKLIKWVGTFTDIDEQKQAARRKDEFMTIASHELKTPLTSIKAYVQLLKREVDENDRLKGFVDRSLIQINKLNNLIVDLLDMSKIENGNLLFNKTVFDFNELLENTVESIRQTYPDICIKKSKTPLIKVYGDELRLEQVIINYLTNAIKYSPECREIEVSSYLDTKGRITVAVKDHGIGIPAHNLPQLFGKFYRVESTVSRFQGLGIGLYICAEILNRHDAKYWVESEPGKGSTFYFSLPAVGEMVHENSY